MARDYNRTPVLAKIKIGDSYYWMKDADARALLDSINDNVWAKLVVDMGSVSGDVAGLADAKDVKSYVDARELAEKALREAADNAINAAVALKADNAAVYAEIAKKADNAAIYAALDSEKGLREAADNAINVAYKAADDLLAADIANKADNAAIFKAVKDEEDARKAADDAINGIVAEKANKSYVDDELAKKVDNSAYQEKVAKLGSDIANNASNIANEAARAAEAEGSLSSRIAVYEGRKADYEDAVNKAHEHSNKSILDGIGADNLLDAGQKTKLNGISEGANKVEQSETNGNIKIDGVEKKVYDDSLMATKVYAEEQANGALNSAKAYTDQKIGDLVLIKYEVVNELPTPSAEVEFNKSKTIYLKKEGTSGVDVYGEYICIKEGANYVWEKIGDTRIDLSNYYTKSEVDNLLANEATLRGNADDAINAAYVAADVVLNNAINAEHDARIAADNGINVAFKAADDAINAVVALKEDKSNLKELAYKDKDDVVAKVVAQTISGVNASYTPAGSVAVSLNNNAIQSKKEDGVIPSFVEGAFCAATYEHTGFSGGSLGEASKSQFAIEGLVATVSSTNNAADPDFECLVFSVANKAEAVTAQGSFTAAVYGTDNFFGGSKAADTFNGGKMPVFEEKVVGVESASFEGTAGVASVGDIVVPAQNAAIQDK